MSVFSNNLRFLRERAGLKLADFEQHGIKSGTMSNYELGKTEPKMDTLIFFSKFFRVSTDNLLFGDLVRYFEWQDKKNEKKSENFSVENDHPTRPSNSTVQQPHLTDQLDHPKQYDPNDGKTHDFDAELSRKQAILDLERAVEYLNTLLIAKDELLKSKDQTITAQKEALKLLEGQINASTALMEKFAIYINNEPKKRPANVDVRIASDVAAKK